MNTRKISKLANELIMDELLGTGQNDESNSRACQSWGTQAQRNDPPHIDHAGRSGHHCPSALPDADLFGRRLILSSFPLPDIIDIFTQMLVTFRVVHSSDH